MNVGRYKVHWRYSKDFVVRHLKHKSIEISRDITTCSITKEIDGKEVLISSESIARKWSDNDCKETARKLSLQQALAFSNIPKATRTDFWEVYRNQTKTPRWSNPLTRKKK